MGRARRKQPDWFIDTTDTLMPLLAAKQHAHSRYLLSNSTAAKKEFRKPKNCEGRLDKESCQGGRVCYKRWKSPMEEHPAASNGIHKRKTSKTYLLKSNGEFT